MRKSIIRRFTRTPDIPTASTADVAFLLILFFMVTTVFRATTLNLKLVLPKAKSTERILIRRNITHLFIDNNGRVFIDDSLVPKERVSSRIAPKIAENQELVTILNIHEDIDYGTVDVVLDQLKEAKAFKITFATEFGG
jgi:biopolymer transport protein ExbD|uniref:Biopolymer transporter ExbD n=1 Tax=candidate division WOR-3 bacterium TaxID=2052148 RepID=A0A7C6AGB4_UNCW3